MKTERWDEMKDRLLPLAVLALAAWQALPGLVAAWGNDLYARGAPWAFVIWLAAAFHSRPRGGSRRPLLWVAVSLLGCIGGSMSGLQVMNHFALAAAVPALFGHAWSGIAIIAGAVVWLPASGWLISHWVAGGLAGWERPLAALLCGLVFILILKNRFRP